MAVFKFCHRKGETKMGQSQRKAGHFKVYNDFFFLFVLKANLMPRIDRVLSAWNQEVHYFTSS